MGYYTYYTCYVIDEDSYGKEKIKQAANRLAEILYGEKPSKEVQDFEFICENGEMKWYEYEDNMKKLSKEFPDMVFELSGNGEDEEDFWKEYFLNGESCYCSGHIEYDPPPFWAKNKMELEKQHRLMKAGINK